MTNEEVKAFWLKHGMKPRVEYRIPRAGRLDNLWHLSDEDPIWYQSLEYRIHPDDLEKFMNTEKKLDLTKPLAFRNRPDWKVLRHLVTLERSATHYREAFLVEDFAGRQTVVNRMVDGRYHDITPSHDFDIINVPERAEKFVNVYDTRVWSGFHSTADQARSSTNTDCRPKGVIKLTFEDDKLVAAEVVIPADKEN